MGAPPSSPTAIARPGAPEERRGHGPSTPARCACRPGALLAAHRAAPPRGRALAAEHSGVAIPTAGSDGGSVWEVQAGDEGEEFVLLRYFPDTLAIKAGDTVRWTDRSKMEPHTVTFLGGEAPPDLIVLLGWSRWRSRFRRGTSAIP